MMKKYSKVIMIFFSCITIGLLVFNINSRYDEQILSKHKIQHIPDFTFYTADGLPYSLRDLNGNKNLYILYYDIECEHCLMQIKEVEKNISSLQDINLLMVSANHPSSVKQFITKHTDLFNGSPISLYDTEHHFSSWFGNSSTPAIYIYNKEQQLIKNYQGLVSAEKLLEYAK